ncbi:MAG: 5'-nucleotidase C-terminal domain-containing protein [Oligoflexia bacterium]|nr:5'-nucleotidase C-terminal domain-containing protein [Oligoflexia bacterium]
MRNYFRILGLLLLFSCSTSQKDTVELDIPVATGKDGLETLVIMGTNDIHGALAPETAKSREPEGVKPVEYQFGGVATLAAYVNALRREHGDRFLWLDGGDEFQGSLESNSEKGAGMVRFFNRSALGGASIGNHEFDFGPETGDSPDRLGALKTRMMEARYPYLAANILDRATGQLKEFPNTFPSKIYPLGKVKVGVIGLSTLDTPKTTSALNVKGLIFSALREATLREAQALRGQGAEIIVIVAHVGLRCMPGRAPTWHMIRKASDPLGECGTNDEMVSLLRSLPGGTVDAVVSGHSHQIVHHWVAGVPVIQAGSFGRFFNLIYLTYDVNQKKLLHDRTRIEGPVPVCAKVFQNQNDCNGDRPAPKAGRGPLVQARFHGKAIEPDEAVNELLRPAFEKAARIKNEPVGETATPLIPDRMKETALGNLVADAVRLAGKADVALVNAGGIRAPIEQGKFNYGAVFRVLPFDNSIVTLKLTGKELKRILRIAESGSRGYAPTSGLKLRLIGPEHDAPSDDLNSDGKIEPWEINRLIEARLADGSPIKDEKSYTLATVDFLVTGGDDVGWAMQQVPAERQLHTDWLIRDAVAQHIRKLSESKPVNSPGQELMDPANPRVKFEKPTKSAKASRRGKKGAKRR